MLQEALPMNFTGGKKNSLDNITHKKKACGWKKNEKTGTIYTK